MVRMVLNFLLAIKMLKNAPLCIFVPKISAHIRDFDKTKCMSFLIKDGKLSTKLSKEDSQCICLTVILIDSV